MVASTCDENQGVSHCHMVRRGADEQIRPLRKQRKQTGKVSSHFTRFALHC